MMTRLAQGLAGVLTPLLGPSRAEGAVARAYAVIYLVYYYVSAQYARALLGIAWLILTPILFIAVYVPILTHVFHGELPGATGPYDYSLFIVAGFLPWVAFSDGLVQGAASLAGSLTVVRNATMPPSVLTTIRVLPAFASLVVGVVIFVLVLAGLGRFPGVRLILFPLSALLLFGFTLGLAWLTASLALFVRDVLQFIPTLLLIEFFACPIVYHPSRAPGMLGKVIEWNPVTPFLALFRASLAPTAEFAWLDLGLASAWTAGALVLGVFVFRRLEGHFGDAV
ncbi:MAG TPA: ABC transporter permease [Planctomycetota bacterium]|nr:ABC transporter permease [Planctomycetota bacterium]